MNIEEANSGAAIRQYAKHIGHVHASASHRGLLGEDQVDWTDVLGALHNVGYKGDVVIESFSRAIRSLPKRHQSGARYTAAPSNWLSKATIS